MKDIFVLWTGGFDSTYRIAQLSRHNVTIQPCYILDNRRSEQNELRAIAEITDMIRSDPGTVCTIRPLLTLHSKDIRPSPAIEEAYLRLHHGDKLGSQYGWLARFAEERNVEFEICLENEPKSKALTCIRKHGTVKRLSEEGLEYCVIDREKSSDELVKVFGRFRFPLPLFDMSKLETLDAYRQLGLEGLVAKTWFCHTPKNGAPCGLCNPCDSVVQAGMSFRLPRTARVRHLIFRKQPIMWALYRKKASLRRFLSARLSRTRAHGEAV